MAWLQQEHGGALRYEDRGEGRPLVLIHGWCFSSAVWKYQLDCLSRSFRVIAPDLPGHGVSDADPEGFTLKTASSAVAHLCSSLGLRDVILCGWSLGGEVALQAVSLMTSRISSLFLVATTPRFTQSHDWKHGLTEKDVCALGVSYRRSPRKAVDSFVSQMLSESEREQSDTMVAVQAVIDTIPLPAVEVALQGLEILKNTDLRNSLKSFAIPAVAMSGDFDSICLPAASRYLSSSLPAELIIFNGAGHAPFLTQPELFNKFMQQCIRRIHHSED